MSNGKKGYFKTNFLCDAFQYESSEELLLTFYKNNLPIDLTDLTIVMEFRLDSQGGELIRRLELKENELEIITETIEEVEITKLKINPYTLDKTGKIFYDVRMLFPNTNKTKFYAGGSLMVIPTTTQLNA